MNLLSKYSVSSILSLSRWRALAGYPHALRITQRYVIFHTLYIYILLIYHLKILIIMHFLFSIFSASFFIMVDAEYIWIRRKSTKAANEKKNTEKNACAAEHHTMCTVS